MIRLLVPAELRFRDVAVRTVAAACKLVGREAGPDTDPGKLDLSNDFDAHMVSAFSEAFNNIAIHAYGRRGDGTIEIEIRTYPDRMELVLRDNGAGFDPQQIEAPELESLPESGMGLFIIHSFVDEFSYRPGSPNVWSLVKYRAPSARQVGAVDRLQR